MAALLTTLRNYRLHQFRMVKQHSIFPDETPPHSTMTAPISPVSQKHKTFLKSTDQAILTILIAMETE